MGPLNDHLTIKMYFLFLKRWRFWVSTLPVTYCLCHIQSTDIAGDRERWCWGLCVAGLSSGGQLSSNIRLLWWVRFQRQVELAIGRAGLTSILGPDGLPSFSPHTLPSLPPARLATARTRLAFAQPWQRTLPCTGRPCVLRTLFALLCPSLPHFMDE